MSNDISTSQSTNELIDCNITLPIVLDYVKLLETGNKLHFKFESSGKEVEINTRSIQKILKLSNSRRGGLENTIHSTTVFGARVEHKQNIKYYLEQKIKINGRRKHSDEFDSRHNNSESFRKNERENRFDVSQGEEWDNKVDHGEMFKRIIMADKESKSDDEHQVEISRDKFENQVSFEKNSVDSHEGKKSVLENSDEDLELRPERHIENFESKPESYIENCNFEERGLPNQISLRFENKNIENICSTSIDNSEQIDIYEDGLITHEKNDYLEKQQFLKVNKEDEEENKESIIEIILTPETEIPSASNSIQREILQVEELKYEKEILNFVEVEENLYADQLKDNFLNISEKMAGNIEINKEHIKIQPVSNEQQEEYKTEQIEMISESSEKIEEASNEIIAEEIQVEDVEMRSEISEKIEDGNYEVIAEEVEMLSEISEKIEDGKNEVIAEEVEMLCVTEEIVSDASDRKKATKENNAEEVEMVYDIFEIKQAVEENQTKVDEMKFEPSEKKYLNAEVIFEENLFLINLENVNDGNFLEDNKKLEIIDDDKNTICVERNIFGIEYELNKSEEGAIILEKNYSIVVDEKTTESLMINNETLRIEIEDNKQTVLVHNSNKEISENYKSNEEEIENEIEKIPEEDKIMDQQNIEGKEDGYLKDISEHSLEIISTTPVDDSKINQPLIYKDEEHIKSEGKFIQFEQISQGESESQVQQEDQFHNLQINLEFEDINSEKSETQFEDQEGITSVHVSEESQTNIIKQGQTITAMTESIVEQTQENYLENFHLYKNKAPENKFIEENQIEDQNSHKNEELKKQIQDETVIPSYEVDADINIEYIQNGADNDNIEHNLNEEIEIETIIIDEQIITPFEDNYRIPAYDANNNDLFESNYMTINLEIPDNRINFFTNFNDNKIPTENIDDTRPEGEENYEHLKKRIIKQSENFQDEITRYGYEDSKLNDTEKSFDNNKKLISMDRAYITNFSSNPYTYKSNFLTTKYDEIEDEENSTQQNEEFLEERKMCEINHTEENRKNLAKKLENDVDIVKIESYTTEFNMQNSIAIEEIKYDEAIDMEENNYTCEVDDVVNYDDLKSPVINRRVCEENDFNFELLTEKDDDNVEMQQTPGRTFDVFDFNLTEKQQELSKNSENHEIENVLSKTPQKFTAQENINSIDQLSESYNEINKIHEANVYFDYKTNIENDLLISLDQYRTDLIENITDDDKVEKIQQIQESARRQYELLTKASSLETIHEVRSVIFNVDTDEEKIIRKRTKEIIIVDDEEEEDNILIDEERPKEKKNFRKNSLTCISRLSLKTLKDDKLYTTTTASNEANTEKRFIIKPLGESKRSSAKLFNTKKWDTKQFQADFRLKQIGLKIAPIKIPARPKLIPNSNQTEKAGCFSPKPTKRSTMPFIKDMDTIDLCFVCKGAVVKPKECKRCQKCVCHVCSFELKDRTKCPDCNCLLVLLPRNGFSTAISSNIKKFPLSKRRSSVFGKREAGRSSASKLKHKFKPDIPASCCNCKDSTIASIHCQKCNKSSCVMCLNSSADSGKCLSCKGNFKTRYSTILGTGPQTLTRKLSQTFRKTPTTATNSGTKVNKKMVHTASTTVFLTACGNCKKSTSNKNKCLNCPKNICSLCYGNIEGEKTCTDCHLWSKLKLNSKQRITAAEQKLVANKNLIRPNSRQLELSNPSKNTTGKEEKIVKCLNCKKNKKSCKQCLKAICVSCKKDSFEQNRCGECRKKLKVQGNILNRISKSDSDSQLLFDDICLICKLIPNEKIGCNNCLKSICSACADVVKQNDNKCPNCNNTSYSVLSLSYKNNSEIVINDSNSNICVSPEKATAPVSLENEIKNESNEVAFSLIEAKCLICARTPYNNLTCNKCNNEVCFTCTYSMKERYRCPKCSGTLSLKEKKQNTSNEYCETTPKTDENYSLLINSESLANSFSPIKPVNKVDDTNSVSSKNIDNISYQIRLTRADNSDQKLLRKISLNDSDSHSLALIDNCLICKGSPIKPKSCTSCFKPICKMCSYEIDDNKCPGCEAELNLVDGLCERYNKSADKLNSDTTHTEIEHSQFIDACLVCKGFPIKPKSCENCHKSVCTICSYELEDPSKCKECKGSYKKISLRNQSKLFTGIPALDDRKSITDSVYGNGPCCVVCKRPPFKAKICWSCMTAIFCTPCSFNFEDSNRCLNCQGPLNKELVIKPLNTSRFNLHSSGIKYDEQQVKLD